MIRSAFPALALAAAAPCQLFFPAPLAPAANAPTVDKALLGMALFWEEQLSSTNTVACGSCHGFARGGGDPRAFAAVHPGSDGELGTEDDSRGSRGVSRRTPSGHYEPSLFGFAAQVTPRKAPTVVNAAYNGLHFYDGRTGGGSFVDPISGQVTATGNTALERMVLEPPVNPIEMGHPGRTWHDVVAKLARSRPLALASELPPRLGRSSGNAATRTCSR